MSAGFHLDADSIYRCRGFEPFTWQEHGFGTRHGAPLPAVTLRQIHSSIVCNAHGLQDREQEGDALITNELHRAIAVRTADCVPILLLDAHQQAVAAVHAGWRGSAAQIIVSALNRMTADFGTQPSDVYAAIGPCIRECCYEVSADVHTRFAATFPEWAGTPPKADGKRNLNLAQANIRQMKAAGVPGHQIFDSGLCTACKLGTFFSFRREPHNSGRLISAISRVL